MRKFFYPHPTPAGHMRLLRLPGLNPEDVILDTDGQVICGLEDGRILRVNPVTGTAETLVNTGGRPLGLDWLPDHRLLVCDCQRGLLAIDLDTKQIEVLVDSINGKKMMVCNNPSVAADGTIYFSDSSTRHPLPRIHREIIEHVGTGRLLRRHLDGRIDVLMDGLQFANGVVLAPDESFVLVAETGAARINRVWLKGAQAGEHEIFADQLPGMPDNLSLGSDGLFWLALPSPADARLAVIHRLPAIARRVIGAIPENLLPPEVRSVLVMAFDLSGRCIHFLEGDPLRFHLVTGVRECHGTLYIGSIDENAVAMLQVP